MPGINITEIEDKRRQHLELADAMDGVGDAPPERIVITVPANYARKIKAAAKARGWTIKHYVMRALDAHYPAG